MADKLVNLEKKVKDLEKRVSKLEKNEYAMETRKSFSNVVSKIREQINEMGIQHLIVLSLKIKPKQTRSEIEDNLRSWNKPLGSWFRGGNFNKRLLGEGIIMKDGVNDTHESQFSLTMRGLREVEKIISKYNL
ncbi:MAG TPA: hypothetical protein VJ571_07995 [Candidatus Nitrosotalea sp.]|nr:hypothetical protein [Candidatus Nitrosotalea sp.]